MASSSCALHQWPGDELKIDAHCYPRARLTRKARELAGEAEVMGPMPY